MAKKPQKELGGPRKMSTGTKVVIGVFAVIMALSMTLPSLTQIFAGGGNSSSSEQEAESNSDSQSTNESAEDQNKEDGKDESSDEEKKEEGAEDATANVPDNESLKSLADQNKKDVEKYSKRLKDDPKDLAAILNLAQTYLSWGGSATYSSTTDEEKNYSKDLINKAIGYFDQYLELRESNAARIQRSVCEYYAGDTDKAIGELQKMTQDQSDYPISWLYLGMLYSQEGNNDKALEAYKKVEEVDPDDEYGIHEYAKQSIASINSSQSSFEDLTNEKYLGTNSKPEEGLPGIIANQSDTASQDMSGIQTIM